MSLNIDNKVYRNMQEQVCANARNISKIKDFLDGLDVEDTVIVLESLSSLNSEQMKVAEQPLAFIVYDEAIYLKTKEDATYFYFERMIKMELGTAVTLSSAVIQVAKLNGATGITVSSVNVYSKSQIDTFLGLKANVTYVDTELAKKADLSGAIFTGPITGPSIVEAMSGYSFVPPTDPNLTTIYAGVVKNGNKITFVIFGSYTVPVNDKPVNPDIGGFIIPAAVANKLVPWTSYFLSTKQTPLFATASSVINKTIASYKASSTKIMFNFYGLHVGFTDETTYMYRHEETFLLSDNLAS